MRNILLALGLVATGVHAAAQHSHSYNRTVFNDASAPAQFEKGLIDNARSVVNSKFPGWNIYLDKVSGSVKDLYGSALNIPGATNEAKAQYVMDNYMKALGVSRKEWAKTRDVAAPKASFVDYEQSLNGHKVVFSKLSFRFTPDGRLQRVRNSSYGRPGANSNPSLSAQDVVKSNAIMEGAEHVIVTNNVVAADWVWFPVPSGNGYELHPAWQVEVEGKEESGHPVLLAGYIDATNGELLYRTNKIEEATDLTVNGMVYKTNTITPATLEPLADLKVTLNSTTYNLDQNGFISNPSNNITADFALEGRWSKVIVANGGGTPANNGISLTGGGVQTHTFTAISEAVNAYYHTTRVHDFMKGYFPTFTNMDNALPTNVELTTSTCNAFYNGSSINFYKAGGGCPSFAEIGDVVYHEYGHGINDKFYGSQGANFSNGAMGEGNADVWGMSITEDSVLGRNTKGTPQSFIRRYDVDHKVYPYDIVGEVHADGEIIAGCWWDYARNVGSFPTMTELFASTYWDLPNEPNGFEGQLYHEVLISAIMNDDDDANLSNGTPHFDEITKAFAKHGIYLLADAVVTHTELAHQPASTPITVNATLTLTNPDYFQALKVIYRNRMAGTWDTLDMVNNAGTYTATIPGQPMASIVDYYFHVFDFMDIPAVTTPNNFFQDPTLSIQSNIPYQFAVGVSLKSKTTFDDGAQSDWTIGATDDGATAGKWIQAKPSATYTNQNKIVQTGADHTTGSGQCMVTGNGTGSSSNAADVDGGKTTLFTPALDFSGFVYPIIEYYRWFSNDRGSTRKNDVWQTQVKGPSGIVWYTIENTYQSDHSWRRKLFALYQHTQVNSGVTVRFVAKDAATSGNQTIEAAVDDFFIYDGAPTSVGNVNVTKASIYPNPANDRIQVDLGTAAKGTMTLYDVTGRAVSAYQLDGTNTKYFINTAAFASGQYTLIIQTENKTIQSQQVVISHQ